MQPLSEVEKLRQQTIDSILGRNRPPSTVAVAVAPVDAPRQPSGRALRWTPADITALALATPADIQRAQARVAQNRDREMLLLLLAITIAEAARRPALIQGFIFSPSVLRYFLVDYLRRTVTLIGHEEITRMVDNFIERARLIPVQLMADLLKGDLPVGLWQSLMRDEIIAAHLVSAAAVAGGFEQAFMYAPTLQPMMEYHLTALNRFAGQLESGGLDLNGDLFARAELYANATRMTRFNFDLKLHEQIGVQQARRVRTILESCPGCVRLAGGVDTGGAIHTVNQGFIPIGDVVPLGGQECKMNDLCYIQMGDGAPSRADVLSEAGRIREALGF
jgi:hypothetical protein